MFSHSARLALASILVCCAVPSGAGATAPPPHGEPKIFSVYLSQRVMSPGQTITSRVVTSPNVGYVEARIETHNAAMHRDGMGKFSLAYTVPWWLPWWFKHEWTLQIIARSVDGVEVKQRFPITIR